MNKIYDNLSVLHLAVFWKKILSGPLLLEHQEPSLWIILGTTVNSIEFQKEKNY